MKVHIGTMRLIVYVALASSTAGAARAQCTPAVQRLIVDQKFDAARAEMQAAIKRNDNDDRALHCMGMIYFADDKPGDAADWFDKAVQANDTSSAHHLWLASALGEQAQHTSKFKLPFLARRVKSEFDRAAQLDPTSIDARHGLIEYYIHAPSVMGGSMDKAKEQAREIAKLSAWRGHFEMGTLLEQDKDLAGAEKEFAAAAAATDSVQATNALGSFYRREKRWSDALSTYDALLKRHPDAAGARLNIAATLVQSGENLDRAEKEVRTWLSAPPADAPKPNFSTAHFLLGQIAEKQGRKDAARAEYQQALQLNPRNANAKRALSPSSE